MTFLKTALAVSAAALAATTVQAADVLDFGQTAKTNTIIATNGYTDIFGTPVATSTKITATDVEISITQLLAGVATPVSAYLNLTANSSGIWLGVQEVFSGSFSLTSDAGGTGINYLTGSFVGTQFGFPTVTSSSLLGIGTLADWTSSVITGLGAPESFALSFTNINTTSGSNAGSSGLSICGTTVCGFNAAVAGNFSATAVAAVPEPASWAMMVCGFGVLGAALRRKKPVVRFA